MTINANTKISTIIKQRPEALEVIIGISPKFEKLRNPLLRKLLASRASLEAASKIGGCSIDAFFDKLQPLGFVAEKTIPEPKAEKEEFPEQLRNLKPEQIVQLDVRPLLALGNDPLNLIQKTIKGLQVGQVLEIINTFKPEPLIQLLQKRGFTTYVETINNELVHTYFFRATGMEPQMKDSEVHQANDGWDEILLKFGKKIQSIDVRMLEMPLPMITILESLDKISVDTALYVYHKRIPVFLLPELKERKLDFRIKEIKAGEVHLLIFKP